MNALEPVVLWRTKLRSVLVDNHEQQVKHCVKGKRVGIGWGIKGVRTGARLDRVCDAVLADPEPGWGKRAADTIRRIGEQAQDGDFVWTRDTYGKYWLGQINGPYRYDASADAFSVDIHQTRPTRWIRRPLNDLEVPGAVIRSFIGTGSSFSRIWDEGARKITPFLWAKANGHRLPDLDITPEEVLQTHLDPYDVEDLVYVWMQAELGYLAFPRSRMRDTPAYEWTMLHRKTQTLGIAQVKTGNDAVDLQRLARAADPDTDTYAVSVRGLYDGDRSQVTQAVKPEVLVAFALEHPELLPPRVRTWFALAS